MQCTLDYKGLVTNYREGGYKTGGRGGAREALPLQKGGGGAGGRKSFSHAEGGRAQQVLG